MTALTYNVLAYYMMSAMLALEHCTQQNSAIIKH